MTTNVFSALRHLTRSLLAGGLGVFLFVGCGQQEPKSADAGKPKGGVVEESTVSPTEGTGVLEPRLHQPFSEATVDTPEADGQWLPDTLATGKSVGRLYTEVVDKWDAVPFQSSAGKWLAYKATLQTELGSIVIVLRPDLAPNHVRSFVSLARAGYYDGLVFERTVREESKTNPDVKLELIEAGCPKGTGEAGYGSIGYWLKDEFSPDILHEEGTVGACHADGPNTGACKFYVTLSRAPFMDGNYTVFGKVVRGMDVARRIFSQPARNDSEFPEGDRPEKPIAIEKVSIETKEVDKIEQVGENR